jgi:hypothetical protein
MDAACLARRILAADNGGGDMFSFGPLRLERLSSDV